MLTGRQTEILEYLKSKKHAKIGDIAGNIYVSETTVRRELAELERMGLLQREHGGAVFLENSEDISIGVRQIVNYQEKLAIAKMAEKNLPSFRTLFIDNSSTALMLAQRIGLRHRTVVTNGITAAMQLGSSEDTTVNLVGGRLNHSTSSLIGGNAVLELGKMQFHLMICSCTSIGKGGVYESSADQCDVKRAALMNSAYKVLLVDRTKFNDRAMYRTARLSDFDAIYTDAPDELLEELREGGNVNIFNA